MIQGSLEIIKNSMYFTYAHVSKRYFLRESGIANCKSLITNKAKGLKLYTHFLKIMFIIIMSWNGTFPNPEIQLS